MSNIVKHLDREWDVMGWPKETLYRGDRIAIGVEDEDEFGKDAVYNDPQAHTYQNLKQLLDTFSSQGHSGFSASYTINLFKKLVNFLPISPLTGEESEWNFIGDGKKQNSRCSHVFMDSDGRAYDGEGIAFRDQHGVGYTSRDSRVYIEFPYTPTTKWVDKPTDNCACGECKTV